MPDILNYCPLPLHLPRSVRRNHLPTSSSPLQLSGMGNSNMDFCNALWRAAHFRDFFSHRWEAPSFPTISSVVTFFSNIFMPSWARYMQRLLCMLSFADEYLLFTCFLLWFTPWDWYSYNQKMLGFGIWGCWELSLPEVISSSGFSKDSRGLINSKNTERRSTCGEGAAFLLLIA